MIGYNLPACAFSPSGFIGIEWFITIPTFTIVVLLGTIIKEKKQ